MLENSSPDAPAPELDARVDPYARFAEWFAEAEKSEPNDPNAYVCTAVAVDSAHKLKSHNDPSVALVGGLTRDGDIHLLDILRARLEFPELKQRLIQLNTKYRSRQLRGFYIEDRASGQSLIQELKRESGVPVIPYKVTHDKIARVSAILPHLEAGRVFLPNYSPWTTDFKRECSEFPSSKHDDQVDALAILIDVLSKMHVTPETWNADIPLAPSLDTYGKSLRQQLMPNSSQFPGWGIGTTQSTIRR
jgi:predicted phage terminase large subunit-like protein